MPRAARVLPLLAAVLFVAAPALAQSWRRNPDAARFARPGAPEVTIVLREEGGGGCGGGGCNVGVAVRSVAGALPSQDLSYYYSDRPGPNPGCLGPHPEALLREWTELVVAPIQGGPEQRPSCGVMVMSGDAPSYWVILRARRAP